MSIIGTQPAVSSNPTSSIPNLLRQFFCLISDLLFVALFTSLMPSFLGRVNSFWSAWL
jgi:hypothetical protein